MVVHNTKNLEGKVLEYRLLGSHLIKFKSNPQKFHTVLWYAILQILAPKPLRTLTSIFSTQGEHQASPVFPFPGLWLGNSF